MMTKPVLVIGNKNYSSWSLRGWLAASHAGIRFEEIVVPLYVGEYKKTLRGYSESGLVPVLIDSGTTVWDSLAICEYLAEQHPELWPVSAAARATARSISAEMHSGFSALRDAMPMNCRASHRKVERSHQTERDISRIADIWTACRRRAAAEGPWLFGRFSIADAMFAPVASRFRTYDVALDGAAAEYRETVLSDSHVRRWYAEAEREKHVISIAEVGA